MKVNVVITPKKNEAIECESLAVEGDTVIMYNRSNKSKNAKLVPVAAFKKWIRFYILPEEKKVGKTNARNQS